MDDTRFSATCAFIASVILLFAALPAIAEPRTFTLKSGDVISGEVVGEDETSFKIETELGILTIKKERIRPYIASVTLKSGNVVSGKILEDSPRGLKLETGLGELFIQREKIEKIDTTDEKETDQFSIFRKSTGVGPERWYYGKERLIDIFYDPTGYVLERNVLYFSGLSWGYGLTDRFQITSTWGDYFQSAFNFRPKYMVYKGGGCRIGIGGFGWRPPIPTGKSRKVCLRRQRSRWTMAPDGRGALRSS